MICKKENCTGCFACYNICPKHAIEMYEDELGFIYPKIKEEECINCGLCNKICPAINKLKRIYPIECYAGKVKDQQKLRESTSGGIATVISEKIIKNGGIVYGAAFVENCSVEHIRITEMEQLQLLKGSKYVHSYIKNSYSLVKEDLLKGKEVLFIGTPCQIAGLKKYLNKDYEKLYLVDIICHGVPSQKFLKDEVKRLNKNINVDKVNFRNKIFKKRTFSIEKNNKTVYSKEMWYSPYYFAFIYGYINRENCYSCIYANDKRVSDLTIGDFWGLKSDSKFYNERNNGISVLLPLNEKGIKLIEMIKNEIDIERRNIYEAINGNDQLRTPLKKDKSVYKIRKEYKKNNNFFKTYKKVFKLKYYKDIIKQNTVIKKIIEIRRKLQNGKE